MKNYMLIVFLFLMAMPFVFSDYNAFDRPYIQDKCWSGGTGDCYVKASYSLRMSDNYTFMDYTDEDWTHCTIYGGSEFKGVPFSYYDYASGYEHHSLLVLYWDGTLVQYDSECQIWDTYTVDGVTMSELALINTGYTTAGGIITMPYMAFAYHDNDDSLMHYDILTLDAETSKFILVDDSSVTASTLWGYNASNFSDRDIVGMAGGQLDNTLNNQPAYDFWFGLYSRANDEFLLITDLDNDGDYEHEAIPDMTAKDDDSLNHQLFFDDMDRNGDNEFILITGSADSNESCATYLEINDIEVSNLDPYSFTTKYTFDMESATCGGLEVLDYTIAYDGDYTLCQVGLQNSPLEVCFNTVDTTTTGYVYCQGFIDSNFTNRFYNSCYYSASDSYRPIQIFTIRNTNWSQRFVGLSGNQVNGDDDIHFYNTTGGLTAVTRANITGSPYTTVSQKSQEVILTKLAGNYSIYDNWELMFSSGKVEQLDLLNTSVSMPDWTIGNDDTDIGLMYVQDLNGDNVTEFIYLGDEKLMIYSMNNTPWSVMNQTAESIAAGFGVTTTTTGATTTTTVHGVPQVVTLIGQNGEIIGALILIFSLAIMGAIYGKSTVIAILGAFVGTVLSVVLGFISTSLLVIILIFMVLLAIIGFVYFGKGGN